MSLIKNNVKLMLKAFAYQIVFSLFGNMLAMGTVSHYVLFLLGSVMIICLTLYLTYRNFWNAGAKEASGGNKHGANFFSVLLLVLIPAIPSIVVGAVSCTGSLYYIDGSYTSRFVFLQLQRLFFTGEYVGIFQTLLPPDAVTGYANPYQPLAFLLAVIPQICASVFGYMMGLHEKVIIKLPKDVG